MIARIIMIHFAAWCPHCKGRSDHRGLVQDDESVTEAVERVTAHAGWRQGLCPRCAPANDAALRGDDDAKLEREDTP